MAGTGPNPASARATALALRNLARATQATADSHRWRAEALRETADAYIAEADGGGALLAGFVNTPPTS